MLMVRPLCFFRDNVILEPSLLPDKSYNKAKSECAEQEAISNL